MTITGMRMERIERLLTDLRYEVELGMIQGEVDESIHFRFIVPTSKTFHKGVVECRFDTRPVPHSLYIGIEEPRLKIVK